MVDTPIDLFTTFCDLARELNEYVPPERVRAASAAPSAATGERPGDEFNRRAAWSEILEPHGWTVDRTAGDVTYWTRPGKARGVSATTGKCHSDRSGDLLYVFTSNAGPFDQDSAYDKFGALAQLDHAGDFGKAAKALVAAGYSTCDPAGRVLPIVSTGDATDDGIVPDFEFATNADLKALDLGVSWVWEKWLQAGTVNLLAAEGGAGKTRFVADLCRRVHLGLPWPDGAALGELGTKYAGDAPGSDARYLAMWVAGDRNHGELLALSEAFGFGERISYSGSKKDPLGGVTLQLNGDFATLYRRVKAARPLFLVIDTAGGATGFNLSKQEEARAFFGPLTELAQRLSVCVIVITHLNAAKKTLGKRAEERVRTVTRIICDSRDQSCPRRIEITKSNSPFPPPIGMQLGETGNEYTTTDVPADPDGSGRSDEPRAAAPVKTPTRVQECADLLRAELAAQPRRVHELRTLCDGKGIGVSQFYAAVRLLDLIQTEDSFGKKWLGLPNV